LQHLINKNAATPDRRPHMQKLLAIIAAVVLVAPAAYAAVYQAALIVA
jgi:hypothetical protein